MPDNLFMNSGFIYTAIHAPITYRFNADMTDRFPGVEELPAEPLRVEIFTDEKTPWTPPIVDRSRNKRFIGSDEDGI